MTRAVAENHNSTVPARVLGSYKRCINEVSISTRLQTKRAGYFFLLFVGGRNVLFCSAFSPSLGTTYCPIQYVPPNIPSGINLSVCESNHRTISTTAVKNARNYVFAPRGFTA
jgi:hypothetical protein